MKRWVLLGILCVGAPACSSPLVLVQRVVDGDTIVLADRTRVRYIGVDTPEGGAGAEPGALERGGGGPLAVAPNEGPPVLACVP
jgi:hypothetical protein